MGPLRAYALCGIKLPDLIGGSDVNIKSTEDVQFVINYSETARQDCAHGAWPVVAGENGCGVGSRVVGEYATCACCPAFKAAAHAVDLRSSLEAEYTARHVVHGVVGQCHSLLRPSVGSGRVFEHVLEVSP